tara:strand:- start:71 stop:388 length:318 start_codon:yes stop_codon:yes gene_type:complete
MIARDDGEHIIEEISIMIKRFFKKFFGLLKSYLLVVRASKSERMAKIAASAMIDHDYGPPHFFSFFLILRGCGSFSTLSVFLGTNTTGATGVTFICQPSSFSSLV